MFQMLLSELDIPNARPDDYAKIKEAFENKKMQLIRELEAVQAEINACNTLIPSMTDQTAFNTSLPELKKSYVLLASTTSNSSTELPKGYELLNEKEQLEIINHLNIVFQKPHFKQDGLDVNEPITSECVDSGFKRMIAMIKADKNTVVVVNDWINTMRMALYPKKPTYYDDEDFYKKAYQREIESNIKLADFATKFFLLRLFIATESIPAQQKNDHIARLDFIRKLLSNTLQAKLKQYDAYTKFSNSELFLRMSIDLAEKFYNRHNQLQQQATATNCSASLFAAQTSASASTQPVSIAAADTSHRPSSPNPSLHG